MKTKIISIAVIAMMALPFVANGQENDSIVVETKSDLTLSSMPKNEISTSIGVVSAFGGVFDFFKVLVEGVGNGIAGNKTGTKFIGTYGIDYYYQVNSWFRPGAKVVYEGLTTTIYDSTDVIINHYNTSTLSVMPSVQFSYFNKKHVKLYSGIDLGVGTIFDDNKKGSGKPSVFFAFNVTPIGIRVGNDRIYGLVETNIGMDALIKGGFGIRF